jgi:hypothetical protein
MMFNDRDLGVLGVGALLAVLCLVLPLPFVGKMVLGLSVLIGFIVLALLRLGPDRIPLEEWLVRRVRFHLQARRYTYQQPGCSRRQSWWSNRQRSCEDAGDSEPRPEPLVRTPEIPTLGSYLPVTLALDEVGIYPLVTVLLAVIGIYFLSWLAQGGAAEISMLIGGLLQ